MKAWECLLAGSACVSVPFLRDAVKFSMGIRITKATCNLKKKKKKAKSKGCFLTGNTNLL